MCDLVNAFNPLRHSYPQTTNLKPNVFTNNWYSYETERLHNMKKNSVGLNTVEPIKEQLKPKETPQKQQRLIPKCNMLLSELFSDWTTRDLLIIIILLQLIQLITISIK
jgi:hypothetical protein